MNDNLPDKDIMMRLRNSDSPQICHKLSFMQTQIKILSAVPL